MKLIFCIHSMNLGGTEKALLGLLNEIDLKENEVTVLLLENQETYLINYDNVVKKYDALEDIRMHYKSVPVSVKANMLQRLDFALFTQLSKAFFNEMLSLIRSLFLLRKAGFSSKKWRNLAAHIKKI